MEALQTTNEKWVFDAVHYKRNRQVLDPIEERWLMPPPKSVLDFIYSQVVVSDNFR